MIAAVSQQATDATEAGLLVFAAGCLLLAAVIGRWPTISGWWALLSGQVEVKWSELAHWPGLTPAPRGPAARAAHLDGLPPVYDWAKDMRELGRPVAVREDAERRVAA